MINESILHRKWTGYKKRRIIQITVLPNLEPITKYTYSLFRDVMARFDIYEREDRVRFVKLLNMFPNHINIKKLTVTAVFRSYNGYITKPLWNLLKHHFDLLPIWRE